MRTRLWMALLALTLLCLVGWNAQGQKGGPAAPRWEYKVVEVAGNNPNYAGDYEARLNQLGLQGWEMVSEHETADPNIVRYTLKRPR